MKFNIEALYAQWLDSERTEELLYLTPEAKINPDQGANFLSKVIENFELLRSHLEEVALARGQELLDAHTRVHKTAVVKGVNKKQGGREQAEACAHAPCLCLKYRVEPQLPPDVQGIYICLQLASRLPLSQLTS